MSNTGIPDRVVRFIDDAIDSVEQLEVLLLLQRTAPSAWDADAVARELRIAPESAARRLETCRTKKLLAAVPDSPVAFTYSPATTGLDRAVRGLADTYAERRVSVITCIFAKPDETIRSFEDAFRIRKD